MSRVLSKIVIYSSVFIAGYYLGGGCDNERGGVSRIEEKVKESKLYYNLKKAGEGFCENIKERIEDVK